MEEGNIFGIVVFFDFSPSRKIILVFVLRCKVFACRRNGFRVVTEIEPKHEVSYLSICMCRSRGG